REPLAPGALSVVQRRTADQPRSVQQLRPVVRDAERGRCLHRDDPRCAHRLDRRSSASAAARHVVARRLARGLGGQYARRGHDQLHREDRLSRILRSTAPGRTLHAHRTRHIALRIHCRRAGDVHEARDRGAADDEERRAALRVRVPRRELRAAGHPPRRALSGETEVALSAKEAVVGRIGRSFVLMERSYRILVQDKELMVLPLISGAITVSVLAGVVYGFGIDAFDPPPTLADVPLFLPHVVPYAIAIFFQAAVVAGATDRLRGGDPTVRSALAAASRRAGPIVLWAVVAATVGMVLRVIEGRFGFVGRIVARIAGASWALATFFGVPVLALEDRSGC